MLVLQLISRHVVFARTSDQVLQEVQVSYASFRGQLDRLHVVAHIARGTCVP